MSPYTTDITTTGIGKNAPSPRLALTLALVPLGAFLAVSGYAQWQLYIFLAGRRFPGFEQIDRISAPISAVFSQAIYLTVWFVSVLGTAMLARLWAGDRPEVTLRRIVIAAGTAASMNLIGALVNLRIVLEMTTAEYVTNTSIVEALARVSVLTIAVRMAAWLSSAALLIFLVRREFGWTMRAAASITLAPQLALLGLYTLIYFATNSPGR